MAPARLDETSFDRFVSDNPIAVIGFLAGNVGGAENAGAAGGGGDGAAFAGLAADAVGKHPGTAYATVASGSRELFGMFGLSGTATVIFRERVVPYLEPGIPDAGQLARLLDRIAALDIGKIHAEIEQERLAEVALATRRVCPTARRSKPG